MSKQNNQQTTQTTESASFDLTLSKEDFTEYLDFLLEKGRDSQYVKLYSIAYKVPSDKMEESASAMHKRKYELNISRKGKKESK
jgi:hypothetical protein